MTLAVVYIPHETLLARRNFSSVSVYPLEVASGLGMGTSVHVSSQCWDLFWHRHLQAFYMLLQSLCALVLLCLEDLVSLVSPIPFGPCKLFSMLLGPWPIWFQVPGLSRLKALDHPSNVGYGFHFMEWALKPVRYWLVTSRGFESLLY